MISKKKLRSGLCAGCGVWLAVLIMGSLQFQSSIANQESRPRVMEQTVDTLFSGFQEGKFDDVPGIISEAGWKMPLASGRIVTRSFLQKQAFAVIALGREAVPCLFKWVMHDDPAIRYIAIYSLQEITGLKPYVPYFDSGKDSKNYRKRAITVWEDWWREKKAAGQEGTEEVH